MNWRKPCVLALLHMSGSGIPKILTEIRHAAQLSDQGQKEYQHQKLIRLLRYAHNHVPYYRRLLVQYGVIKNDVVNLENFRNIPVLTKKSIRTQKDRLHSDQRRYGQYRNTSGGSTGEPVMLLQDKMYSDWNIANKIWIKLEAGQEIGERELRFWGSERDLIEGKERLSIRMRNWLYNRKEFNTFRMTEKDMARYVEEWNRYNPLWIEAYVQSIYEFARFIQRQGIYIRPPDKGILTSAGTLYPHMQRAIAEVFRCKVYNRYGSREVGDIAFGQDMLKICFWNQYVEEIDGRIYVTNLNNFSMPLIRYDIGDMGELQGMTLQKIQGRVNDILRTADGVIDSAAVTTALYHDLHGNRFTSFCRYQLNQKTPGSFLLKVVVDDHKEWKKERSRLRHALVTVLGDVEVIIKEVKHIAPQKNGKYRYIRSEVA